MVWPYLGKAFGFPLKPAGMTGGGTAGMTEGTVGMTEEGLHRILLSCLFSFSH